MSKAIAIAIIIVSTACASSMTFTEGQTTMTMAMGNATMETSCEPPADMGKVPGSSTSHPCVRIAGGEVGEGFVKLLTTLPGAILKGVLGVIAL